MNWNKCSELLPERQSSFTKFSNDVIVYSPTLGVDIGSYYNNGETGVWYYRGQEWPDVSHWMPLPLQPSLEE